MAIMADRIRQRRKALGLTAAQAAKALGVSRATVYRYEAGQIEKLPARALEPLAALLKTTPSYLLTGEGDATADAASVDITRQDADSVGLSALQEEAPRGTPMGDLAVDAASNRKIAVFTKAVGRMSREDYQKLEAMARQMFQKYFDEDTGLVKDDE